MNVVGILVNLTLMLVISVIVYRILKAGEYRNYPTDPQKPKDKPAAGEGSR